MNNFIWEYKDKLYVEITPDDGMEMKCIESGSWYGCVLYKSMDNGSIYVREINDFHEKFKLIKINE